MAVGTQVRDFSESDRVYGLVGGGSLADRGRQESALSRRKLIGKRARLVGTVLRARPLEEKAHAVQAFAHDVVTLFDAARLRAIVDRVFPAEEAADAFDHMAGSGKFGKALLAF